LSYSGAGRGAGSYAGSYGICSAESYVSGDPNVKVDSGIISD